MVNAHRDIKTQYIIVPKLHDELLRGNCIVTTFTRTRKSGPLLGYWIPVGALFKRIRSLCTVRVTDNTSFVGTKLIGATPPFNLMMETDLVSETCYVSD